ncbi:MAG: radical SAM protein [Pseudonocardiales bacterium]|nr:radical SAM protein [Pseudonocardiales bacterium]
MTSLIAGYEATAALSFLWLEITGKCQLRCIHCYAESGPRGTHGAMKPGDWRRVIDEAATLGTRTVQFIGGEPTLHPAISELIGHVLSRGMIVEVFSNLVHVSSHLWSVFSQPGVRLATSYYADQDRDHEAVTGRRGSYTRTMTNIAEAVRRSIPLRVGLINVLDEQRVEQARQQLETLGVTNFSTDRLRQVGRGVGDQRPDSSQLCGGCARAKVAVASNGDVWPCVFARWMPMGNVQATPLRDIVTVSEMEAARAKLSAPRPSTAKCAPETPKCSPETQCQPANDPC